MVLDDIRFIRRRSQLFASKISRNQKLGSEALSEISSFAFVNASHFHATRDLIS